MRIEWEHETFESGLETWRTEFRGMVVEIRCDPAAAAGILTTLITAGSLQSPLYTSVGEISETVAMTDALKWVNGYWDELEDGPNANYEVFELPPES